MNAMKSDKATERDGMAVKRSPLRRGWDERKFSVSWRHCQKSEEIQRSNMNTRQGGQSYMKSQKRVFTVVIVLSHKALLGFTFLYRSVAYVMLYNIQFPILCFYGFPCVQMCLSLQPCVARAFSLAPLLCLILVCLLLLFLDTRLFF